jgi:uncharacterized protein
MLDALSNVSGAIGLSPAQLMVSIIAILCGGFIKGYTGFGASMLWVTGLSLVLPPLQVVPMVLMFEVATSLQLLPQVWREVDWRSLMLLLLGTCIATPIGVHALASFPADPVRIALALVVLLSAVAIWRGFALQSVPGPTATLGIGLLAGLLNGSMAIVGPPVILFYFATPIGMAIGRASIITFFLGTDSFGTATFATQGLITTEILWRTAVFIPLVLIGVWIGARRFFGTKPETFRKVTLVLLMGLSGGLLARALSS